MVPSLGITVRNRRDPPLPACHSSDTVLASGVPPGSRAEFPASQYQASTIDLINIYK